MDLALHTANNRLAIFACQAAPVQVSYLGYAGSSGLTTMDYRLSDPYLDPPGGDESIYSEQTVRLPETYWCYQPLVDLPPQPPPALEKGFITFGCLNNFCKLNEPLLSLWARLLGEVPHSRLLLHALEGSHRRRVLEHLQRDGIDPQRVSFMGRLPLEAYFEQFRSIDIALDTFPYGGGTTTCNTLWMGVPVVSLAGTTAVGRAGLSILSNVGLPELVANTPEEYVRLAAPGQRSAPVKGSAFGAYAGGCRRRRCWTLHVLPAISKPRIARCGGTGASTVGKRHDPSTTDRIRTVASSGGPVGRGGEILSPSPGATARSCRSIAFLGVLAGQAGHNDEAVDLIRRALALSPNYAEAHNNLGNALKNKGQLDEAVAAYRQAIALRPHFPEAHYNLGNALKR